MSITNTTSESEDWTFLEYSTKQHTHGFHLYPARMHPQIAKRLITKYAKPNQVVFDPFMGSGGVLVESLIHGNNTVGIDINPFAVLLSKVKTTPIEGQKLTKIFDKLINSSKSDLTNKIPHDVAPKSKSLDLDFWYKKDVLNKLKILKHHIFDLRDDDVKDFFKICFSLTSRKCSNQRNSIYKIYRMNSKDLESFNPNVFDVFADVCKKNIIGMDNFVSEKKNAKAFPILGDSRNIESSFSKIPDSVLDDDKAHLVVTSPPYGDHSTTVAYGQFSKHLGLWLELPEEQLLAVDKVGLGGRKKDFAELESDLLDETIQQVEHNDKQITKKANNPSRAQDVFAFFFDLDSCLNQISQNLKKGKSHCCFVVANRTVRRVKIPTDEIIVELAKKYGFTHTQTIYRTIANKAMSSKNAPENISDQVGETMTRESIVIWKY